MVVDTKEKLVEALSRVGIVGEWIDPDEYGFSRNYKFNACGTEVIIEWYCNYSEIQIGNARMWFTHINIYSGYPYAGEWIEFTFKGEKPLHLKVKEQERTIADAEMEIVRQLFLQHTRNSGGCSTRDFCEKLGVDPYKSVKFEFEESKDEK